MYVCTLSTGLCVCIKASYFIFLYSIELHFGTHTLFVLTQSHIKRPATSLLKIIPNKYSISCSLSNIRLKTLVISFLSTFMILCGLTYWKVLSRLPLFTEVSLSLQLLFCLVHGIVKPELNSCDAVRHQSQTGFCLHLAELWQKENETHNQSDHHTHRQNQGFCSYFFKLSNHFMNSLFSLILLVYLEELRWPTQKYKWPYPEPVAIRVPSTNI